jgi:hypothetical protein
MDSEYVISSRSVVLKSTVMILSIFMYIYGVNHSRRMLDKILCVADNSNYYSQFYHPYNYMHE